MIRKELSILFLFLFSIVAGSQAQQMNSAEIYHDIEKFASPYRVLYLAAHPDDENTRLISYLDNDLKARTAYLSLTRGDGGQNLIGDEKNALLGVLRTQELLSARKIDGGEQFFTRAVDFGYSKTSEESFMLWGKDSILSDVVYIIRHFKPHVIVNRFPMDNYNGHGHHHASAILSNEAFEVAIDSNVFPEQLKHTETWKPITLFHNSSSWWDKTLEERSMNDESIYRINIGKYNSLMGYSYNEMAAHSRSQHKSQGFGSAPRNGDEFEYLQYLKGNFIPDAVFFEEMLDPIDRKWLELKPMTDSILSNFNYNNPSASVDALLMLRDQAKKLDSNTNRFDQKISDLNEIIIQCLGISLELIVEEEVSNRNSRLPIKVDVINRSELEVYLKDLKINDEAFSWNRKLESNIHLTDTFSVTLTDDEDYTLPYWLSNEFINRFDHRQVELKYPDTEPINGDFGLNINGTDLHVKRALIYKWTDRVKGGLQKELKVLPEITLEFDKAIYIPRDSSFSGNMIIHSFSEKIISGQLNIEGNDGVHFEFEKNIEIKANTSMSVAFTAKFGNSDKSNQSLSASFVTDNDTFNQSLTQIEYDHIKSQSVLMECRAKFVPVKLPQNIGKIAYVEGPDNEMIVYLREMGCSIDDFTKEDLLSGKLEQYDVLLFGIRSLNVDPEWNRYSEIIHNYMKQGGLVVVQYQTSRNNDSLAISPYSFEISRNRVTDEKASANIRKPEHKILNKPFVLGRSDFDGWNQERGLYFAENWSNDFQTVISWHDKNELDHSGALIIGDFGKGAFIYTGISFFRHIPYGVPGSYKLFLNILSHGQK